MLSKRSKSSASDVFAHACFLRIIPFSWDKRNFRITILQNRYLVLPLLITSGLVCQTIFGYLRYLWLIEQNDLTPAQHVMFIVRSVAFTIGTIFSIHNLLHRYELEDLINQLFNLLEQLERDYMKEKVDVKPNGCERILRFFPRYVYWNSIILGFAVLRNPLNSRYYTSMFKNSPFFNWILIPFAILECANFTALWLNSILSTTILICYWSSVCSWLQEMNIKHTDKTYTEANVRNPQNSLLIYRSFQLLNRHFNLCFQKIIFPFIQCLIVFFPSLCNHTVLRFHHKLSPTVLLTLPFASLAWIGFLMTGIRSGASLNTRSTAYLKALETEIGISVVKAQLKCLIPIRVQFGDYMFLQKFTTCRVFGLVVYWTMRSLLLFHD